MKPNIQTISVCDGNRSLRTLKGLFVAVSFAALALSAWAQSTERHTFSSLNQAIPDGSTAGLSDNRSITSTIANLAAVRVKLKITGRYNGDLYAYVRHANSQTTNFCVLLNRSGRSASTGTGYSDAGFDVTFDHTAANDIHLYRNYSVPPAGNPLTGTWQPSGRKVDPFLVLDTSSRTAGLNSFKDTTGSGEWTLFVADVDSGATNMLVSWELELIGTTLPTLVWSNPSAIVYGTALSSAQLNASAGWVAGSFVYSPPVGTVLPAGNHPLSVTFYPLDTVNYSPNSKTVTISVQKSPLTVTANSTSRLYGDPNPTFTGSIVGIKNNDAISATYFCGATPTSPVSGYPIVPTALGSALANYTVSLVNGTLTVNRATLTVTANNASRLYGDPNPAFSGTIAGVKNSETITVSYNTTATQTSSVGNYAIVPTPSGSTLGNYTVVLNNATLQVNRATLSIIANNANRAYGDANPVFTGNYTGAKNGETFTLSFTTPATASSPVGPYAITPSASGATIGNYTVSASNGTLTVGTATLVFTANNASRFYGDANPVFTGTITGVKNGETITATYSTTATATSPVSTYAIVPLPSGATLANYAVTLNNGTLTVNKAALTITANNANRLYGNANPVFTGTITGIKNSEAITATYSSGASATSIVGNYPITPSPSGTTLANYNVTLNNGTLTVSPAPLTVTANNASRAYGDPNPSFSGSISGIKNGETITASYLSPATSASPVGAYAIVPTPSGTTLANYAVTLNNGVLTVNQAGLTVTANNASRFYGDANPLFTGTITGIKNGETITTTYSSTAGSTTAVGSYPIVPSPSGATLANYSVTLVNGTLTINKAGLTVTVNNASRAYGDPNPVFTGTITGIKNSEAITASYATTAGPATPIGAYDINPSPAGSTLANYNVTLNKGTLTISAAGLTITANNAERFYGDPNPVFTGTIVGIKNGESITATYLCNAVPTSSVGPWNIFPSAVGTTLGNYSITLNNGLLTIKQAPLTVTANNANRLFGTLNPVFTGNISGIKNADAITATYNSGATLSSPVGSYAIVPTPSGTALGNYAVTLVNGVLSVTQAGSSGSLAASGNPVRPGQSVTFTMTLTPVAPTVGTPAGAVQFRIDGVAAGGPVNVVGGVATYSTASLLAGNRAVVAEYPGNVNFKGVTNTLSPVLLVNTPPVAGADTIDRYATNGAKVEIAELLKNDSDADGNAISFVSASTSSANGGTVTVQGGWVYYEPKAGFTNVDSFTYTVQDVWGAQATGTVSINLKPDNEPALNLTITDLGDGSYRLRFDGIPNRFCIIQYTTSLQTPNWQELTSGTSDSVGIFEYTDRPSGGIGSRFYRSLYP